MKNDIFSRLSRSRFRSSFKLGEKERGIVREKGIEVIRKHAFEILDKKIRVMVKNDGRQTPFKGHPVFIAQHATATCCRSCIEKWYKISKDKALSSDEVRYFSEVIIEWIKTDYDRYYKQ